MYLLGLIKNILDNVPSFLEDFGHEECCWGHEEGAEIINEVTPIACPPYNMSQVQLCVDLPNDLGKSKVCAAHMGGFLVK